MSDPTAAGPVYRRGDRGPEVSDLRRRLRDLGLLPEEPADGRSEYDAALEDAVRRFQRDRGLTADGVVGRSTYRALEEARWSLGDRVLVHLPGNPLVGDDVIALQRRLLDLGFPTGRADGHFGATTAAALREFQRNVGIPPDGTCGPATLKALHRLAPRVQGGRPNALRAEERIRAAGPRLSGKVVVLDAAASVVTDPARREAVDQMATDLARRVEGRLVATGVQAFLSAPRAGDQGQEPERARFANRAGANLCVSLRVEAPGSPDAVAPAEAGEAALDERPGSGVATYFFGMDAHGVRSSVGERFAGLVQREIVARTDLVDRGSQARSWDLLRLTTMPAVCIELSHRDDGRPPRVADPQFRDVLAEAVVVAVQRLYLDKEADPPTGILTVAELSALRDAD